ncbi:MAG: hypothetical protein LBH76_09380 [Propionibacteriaceae bacterium]|jgi:hypothetical protein|nr:hypothetical protein [Propionibacteriaceae bacterium]
MSTPQRNKRHKIGTGSLKRCPMTAKLRFRNRQEAKDVLVKAAYERSLAVRSGAECHRREVRCYWCGVCHGWHLTSRPEESAAAPVPAPPQLLALAV